jgi:hypothetical protein
MGEKKKSGLTIIVLSEGWWPMQLTPFTWRNVVREAHTGLNLEKHSEGSPHQINVSVRPSVHLSVCLSVMNTKTRRIFT